MRGTFKDKRVCIINIPFGNPCDAYIGILDGLKQNGRKQTRMHNDPKPKKGTMYKGILIDLNRTIVLKRVPLYWLRVISQQKPPALGVFQSLHVFPSKGSLLKNTTDKKSSKGEIDIKTGTLLTPKLLMPQGFIDSSTSRLYTSMPLIRGPNFRRTDLFFRRRISLQAIVK